MENTEYSYHLDRDKSIVSFALDSVDEMGSVSFVSPGLMLVGGWHRADGSYAAEIMVSRQ